MIPQAGIPLRSQMPRARFLDVSQYQLHRVECDTKGVGRGERSLGMLANGRES